MNVTLDGPFGPNPCQVNHDPQGQRIHVDSRHKLLSEGMRDIEQYLGLNMSLGKRWVETETQTMSGFLTIWSYLQSCDCDWS